MPSEHNSKPAGRSIVLVNQSSGYLTVDIANAFAAAYERVTLVAGDLRENGRPLDPRVRVRRIAAYDRRSKTRRLLTWLRGTLGILWILLVRERRGEVLYFTNPPMAYLLAGVMRRPFSVVVYDIYPEALASVGIRTGNPLYRWWAARNRRLFRRARCVFTLSESMRVLLERYAAPEKIRVVHNWAALETRTPLPKTDNPFVREHGLEGRFTVLYSGNIGFTHSVEQLVALAARMSGDDRFRFVIVGEGGRKAALQEQARREGLHNCLFLTWQPAATLPHSLAAADVAVVTLSDGASGVSVPSKTYNLMAAGAPLLCIASPQTELSRLVETYDNGRCFRRTTCRGCRTTLRNSPPIPHDVRSCAATPCAHRGTSRPKMHGSMYRRYIKRPLDLAVSFTALLCLSPLLAGITLWLHFANKGAGAFFFQERPGRGGRIFRVVKFKTMTDARDSNGNLLPDAQRLTKVGKFVRSTSLDELPQLVNVLKGDMSLVGPRPLLPRYLPLYSPEQARRHEVRPGITGWAQVNGYRGDTSITKRIEHDLYYIENWSLGSDFKIMFLTVFKGFINKNAY